MVFFSNSKKQSGLSNLFQPFMPLILLYFGYLATHFYFYGIIRPSGFIGLLLLFLSLDLFFAPRALVPTLLGIEFILYEIHFYKLSYNATPLLALDLLRTEQIGPLIQYLDFKLIGLLSFLVLALIFLFKSLRAPIQQPYFKIRLGLATILPLIIGLQLKTNLSSRPETSWVYANLNLTYIISDLSLNSASNGLLVHLFQTLDGGLLPEEKTHHFYDQTVEIKSAENITHRPDIFLIVCESCYTSLDDKFETPIKHLLQKGFGATTMYSPVYGGNTADAEFEILTGLPALTLPGIKYQYFADQFSPSVEAMPKALVESGYVTSSFHNYLKAFWRRNIVYPKFSFQKMIFGEDMGWTSNLWPEDGMLFERVLSEYRASMDSHSPPQFNFLLTVATHGPYWDESGSELEAFNRKLKETTAQIENFMENLRLYAEQKGRDYLVLVVADHKPHLPVDFLQRGLFDSDFYTRSGMISPLYLIAPLPPDKKKIVGEVPLFIKSSKRLTPLKEQLLREMNQKPLYCLPGNLVPSLNKKNRYFSALKNYCGNQAQAEAFQNDLLKGRFEEGLLYQNLFNSPRNRTL